MDILQAPETEESEEEEEKAKPKTKNDIIDHIKRKKMKETKRMREKYDRMLRKINITPVSFLFFNILL